MKKKAKHPEDMTAAELAQANREFTFYPTGGITG